MHLCPTRLDREPALFAHALTLATCQGRQRQHYHKCWTCAHRNAALNGAANGSAEARRALVAVRPVGVLR
jgi:hypothetical protein